LCLTHFDIVNRKKDADEKKAENSTPTRNRSQDDIKVEKVMNLDVPRHL